MGEGLSTEIEAWAIRLAAEVTPWIPSSVGYGLASLAGALLFEVNRVSRAAVLSNMRGVLGDRPDLARVARSVFLTAARNYYDLLRLHSVDLLRLRDSVEVVGQHYLEVARAGGRGLILASAHIGNIEMVAQLGISLGYEVVLPVESLRSVALLDALTNLRQSAGITCVPVGRRALPVIVSALNRNAIVGIGADRVTVGEGEWFPFFGRPARFPIAAAALAMRTGAPLLSAWTERLGNQRYRLTIDRPIVRPSGVSHAEAVRSMTADLVGRFEHYIAIRPDQWVVFRPVWEDASEIHPPQLSPN